MTEPEKIETVVELAVPAGYRELERLDVYLVQFIQNATRTKVQRGIKEGRVTVNGREVRRVSHKVHANDLIACRILRPPPMAITPEAIPLTIVFEDEHLIVVDKAAGMVVHPAYGNRTGTLVHALLHHVGAGPLDLESGDEEEDPGLSLVNAAPRFAGDPAVRPGIVHRLDKDTSGLMVVAKNDVAHQRLAKQFAERSIRRVYEALVWGRPQPPEGRVETSVGRDPRDRRKMAVVRESAGKIAATRYETLETMAQTSRLSFKLETGRTHQIRVHARHLGHPVLGDAVYGGTRIASGPDTARRRAFFRNIFEIMPRQALHARTLGFRHPATGEDIDLESPVPADMSEVLERLRTRDPL